MCYDVMISQISKCAWIVEKKKWSQKMDKKTSSVNLKSTNIMFEADLLNVYVGL